MGTRSGEQGRAAATETLKRLSSSRCCFTPSARTRAASDRAGVGLGAAGSGPPRCAHRDARCLRKQPDLAWQILGEGEG